MAGLALPPSMYAADLALLEILLLLIVMLSAVTEIWAPNDVNPGAELTALVNSIPDPVSLSTSIPPIL